MELALANCLVFPHGGHILNFSDLPAELVEFISTSIDSVEQVHVLLALHANPSREWTVAELTHELRSVESSISRRLVDLYGKNVLARPASAAVRFLPGNPKAEAAISLLAKTYRERPARVIELIYSKPPQAIQAFADAFKFRKDEDK